MKLEKNNGEVTELVAGTILRSTSGTDVTDSFRVKYEGAKNGRAYFDVLNGWQQHGVQLCCPVAELEREVAYSVEAGVLVWLRLNGYRHNKANYVTL